MRITGIGRVIAACSGLALLPMAALAQQSSDIITHRPSFSASPYTVGAGVWQGEFGYLLTNNDDSPNQQTLPQALIRYGFGTSMEFQLDWAGYTNSSGNGASGFSDPSIGFKWRLSEGPGPLQMSLLAELSLPIGGSELTSDSLDPAISFLWTYDGIADFFGTVEVAHSNKNFALNNGIGVAFAFGVHKSLFFEHQMNIPENGGTSHSLNTGFAWLSTTDSQIDINFSLGLNDRAADFTLGAGYARRFR